MLYEATDIVTEVTNCGCCDYTTINLNCGCPQLSPKVAGKGCFGASLMNEAYLVRDIVQAMDKGTNSNTPITVKCPITLYLSQFDMETNCEGILFVVKISSLGRYNSRSFSIRTGGDAP